MSPPNTASLFAEVRALLHAARDAIHAGLIPGEVGPLRAGWTASNSWLRARARDRRQAQKTETASQFSRRAVERHP